MTQNPTVKPTGLDAISTTLTRGSTGDQVKALQQYLAGLGYSNVKPDGVFGPLTEQAVKQYQADNGLKADGYFGPNSLAKAKAIGGSSIVAGVPGSAPKTQAELDAIYTKSLQDHPTFKGNSAETLANAVATGDFSGILNAQGQPFSKADQDAAMAEAGLALQPGFDIQKKQDTADVEAQLKQKQLDYQNWLDEQAAKFQEDKNTLDQNAADKGVLFSGGRVQKETNLGSQYNKANAYQQASYGTDIGTLARGYQGKYGDTAASDLSSLYNLKNVSYNPSVATGGVTSGGLSAMYNPNGLGYQGSVNVANTANKATRAAGLLWNKGNKLLATGYKNQF